MDKEEINNSNVPDENEVTEFKFDKQLVKNSFYSILTSILNISYALSFSYLLIRNFPKSTYGGYELILGFFIIGQLFALPGLKTVLLRAVSQDNDGMYRSISRFSLKISFIGSFYLILVGIIYYFSNSTIDRQIIWGFIFSSLFFPFYFSLMTWMDILVGKENYKALFKYDLIIFVVREILLILIWYYKIENLLLLFFCHYGIFAIANIILYNYCKKYVKNDVKVKDWKKDGIILSLLTVSTIIFGSVDKIVIGNMLSLEELANYAIVVQIIDIVLTSIKKALITLHPRIFKHNYSNFFSVSIKFFLISFSIPIVASFIIQYPIIWIYSEKYSEVIPFVKIVFFCIPFRVLIDFYGPYLIKHNLIKELNITKIASIISTLLLYFILIPKYKILGAAIAMILFYIVQLLFYVYFTLKDHKKTESERKS